MKSIIALASPQEWVFAGIVIGAIVAFVLLLFVAYEVGHRAGSEDTAYWKGECLATMAVNTGLARELRARRPPLGAPRPVFRPSTPVVARAYPWPDHPAVPLSVPESPLLVLDVGAWDDLPVTAEVSAITRELTPVSQAGVWRVPALAVGGGT